MSIRRSSSCLGRNFRRIHDGFVSPGAIVVLSAQCWLHAVPNARVTSARWSAINPAGAAWSWVPSIPASSPLPLANEVSAEISSAFSPQFLRTL